tara:strand:- start:1088 stop:1741 length:654 start_codon:yes stop_codon:yes gene_type:complete
MANSNVAFGLRPYNKVGANYNSTGTNEYRIATGNTNRIYQGSPVIPLNTGFIDIVGASAGGSVAALGVFYGCEYVSSTTGERIFSNNWPGSGADTNHPVKAFVYDDPNQVFLVAGDADTGTATEAAHRANVFGNAPMVNADAGNNTTGISTGVLDVSGVADTATLFLRVMGIAEDPENADFSGVAGIPYIVKLNAHFNSNQARFDSQTTSLSLGLHA